MPYTALRLREEAQGTGTGIEVKIEKNMSDSLRSLVSHLPPSALKALVGEESGRLKDVMLQLVQLVDAFQDLLNDQQGVSAHEPSEEAAAEWEARAEVLMVHAEYVMTGKARMPSAERSPDRDNVVKMTERLKEVSSSCDIDEDKMPPSPGRPARVIAFSDHSMSTTLQ